MMPEGPPSQSCTARGRTVCARSPPKMTLKSGSSGVPEITPALSNGRFTDKIIYVPILQVLFTVYGHC